MFISFVIALVCLGVGVGYSQMLVPDKKNLQGPKTLPLDVAVTTLSGTIDQFRQQLQIQLLEKAKKEAIRNDIIDTRKDINDTRKDINDIRKDINDTRKDINDIRKDINDIRKDIAKFNETLKKVLDTLDAKFEEIATNPTTKKRSTTFQRH